MAKILPIIADDPDLIPNQLRRAFHGHFHRVEAASTGADGIDNAPAEPPDVIRQDP